MPDTGDFALGRSPVRLRSDMHRNFAQLVASLCLLAVWIATPLLSVAHLALEEHSYCAEHERLEEGAHGKAQNESSTSAIAGVHVAPDLPGEGDEDHEDCAFGDDFTRECLHCLPSQSAHAAPTALVVDPFLLASIAPATSDLLLLAPKNSPPIAS